MCVPMIYLFNHKSPTLCVEILEPHPPTRRRILPVDIVEDVLRETKYTGHAHITMVICFKNSAVSEGGVFNNERRLVGTAKK